MHGQKGSDRIPMTFFNMHSPGLTILPTHRVLCESSGVRSEDVVRAGSGVFRAVQRGTRDHRRVYRTASCPSLQLKPWLDLAALMPDLSEKQRAWTW